jgi:DNA modification methylase
MIHGYIKNNKVIDKKINLFPKNLLNSTILGSAENMSMIPDNSLHLMITSPPYNVSKEYDRDLSLSEYLEMLKKVFTETYRVLVNGGRACINVANLGRKPYIPLSDYISQIMIGIGFNMRGEIIWNKAASASPSTAWGSWMSASNPTLRDIHEYILVFSKGDYKRHRNKAEMEIKHNFPIDLPYRLIQLYSFETDIILDPFIGSGTTAVAALKSSRKYVGFEINPDYIKLTNKRVLLCKKAL